MYDDELIFFRDSIDLPVGSYNLGQVEFDVGYNGFSISLGTEAADVLRLPINAKLSEVTSDYISPEIVHGIKGTLKKVQCDLDKIIIKEVALEGPAANVGLHLQRDHIGAKANLQHGAARLTLDTEFGELDFKLKRGWGIGYEYVGTSSGHDKKIAFSNVELALRKPKPESHASQLIQQAKQLEHTAIAGEQDVVTAAVSQMKQEVKSSANSDLIMPNSDNPQAEFIELTKMLQKRYNLAELEQQKLDVLQTCTNMSIFLSGVASFTHNRDIAKCANGLNGITQSISGMYQMKSALAGGLGTFTGSVGFLGGVGLVLGGISLLASLFDDDDDDNGLGEALSQIYSAVTGMWSDMREGFKETWRRMDVIQSSLSKMEQANYERFKAMMAAIDHNHRRVFKFMIMSRSEMIQHQKINLTQLVMIKGEMSSYLGHIVDRRKNEKIREIAKSEICELHEHLNHYATVLVTWLTESASISARTGDSKQLFQFFGGEHVAQHEMLGASIFRQNIDATPMRLFADIAQAVDLEHFPQVHHLALVNLQDWCEVLQVYIALIQIGLPKITQQSVPVQEAYLHEVHEVNKIVNDTLIFLDLVAHSSSLWEKLLAHFQYSFKPLESLIRKLFISDTGELEKQALYSDMLPRIVEDIELHYLQFMALFCLIDRDYIPTLQPLLLIEIQEDINLIKGLHDQKSNCALDSIKKLQNRVAPDASKASLLPHLDKMSIDLSVNDITRYLRNAYQQSALRKKLVKSQQQLHQLIDDFTIKKPTLRQVISDTCQQQESLHQHCDMLERTLGLLQHRSLDNLTIQALEQRVKQVREQLWFSENSITGVAQNVMLFAQREAQQEPEQNTNIKLTSN